MAIQITDPDTDQDHDNDKKCLDGGMR